MKIEKKQHMWDKSEENIHHLIYIYIYISKKYNVCNKRGHKTMVHVMKIYQNLTTSLKNTLPLSSMSYANFS